MYRPTLLLLFIKLYTHPSFPIWIYAHCCCYLLAFLFNPGTGVVYYMYSSPLEIELDIWNIPSKMIMHKVVILYYIKRMSSIWPEAKSRPFLLLRESPHFVIFFFFKSGNFFISSFMPSKKGGNLSHPLFKILRVPSQKFKRSFALSRKNCS